MRLKYIDIVGFKSFPDKTRVVIDKPLTVVVGPNGSGKSNIADAVLWVTGEQSAKAMRGGRMEDVIFGGTKRRAPTGFAEVSLTLDNEDGEIGIEHTEVVITRRYYRSGESEYYINRKSSRLRDILELLMDTGLGREGYSVIGQGRIDEILSARSRDRRDIFEEAVGISRYRHRKEDAEKRLAQTDENLTRAEDKIAELELQLEPLREQAEVARRYLRLRDSLRDLEIALWAKRLAELRGDIQKAASDAENVSAQLRTTSSEAARVYRDIEDADNKRRELEAASDALRKQAEESERRAGNLSQAHAVLKTQLENNLASIESIREDVTRREEQESGIEAQIRERGERADELGNEEEEARKAAAELDIKLGEIITREAEGERERAVLLGTEREAAYALAESRAKLSGLTTAAQELSDRETQEAAALITLADELERLRGAAQSARETCGAIQTERDEHANKLRGFEIRLQSRKNKLNEAEEAARRLSSELDADKARARALTQMEREHEGYSKAVRAVMSDSARGVLRGIHGTAGSLMKTDGRYAAAIETALGAAIGNVVVGTEEDGKAAINMLKRRDGGRATFLPLSTIRGNTLNERGLEDEPGFEGVALDLIRFDETYRGVFASLLGRVAIVETLDDAIRVSRKYNARFRLVTLDGQVISAGGAMTGGSNAGGAGILSRAGELERLNADVAAKSERLKRLDGERNEAAREAAAAEFELDTAREDARDIEARAMRAENELEAAERLLAERENAHNARTESLRVLRGRIGQTDKDIDELRERISELESKESDTRKKLSERGELSSAATAEREGVQAEIAAWREKAAAFAAAREAVLGAIAELRKIRLDSISATEEKIVSAEELESRNESLRAEMASLAAEEEEARAEIESIKAREGGAIAEKLELEARRTALDKLSREKSREEIDLERERGRLEQRKAAFEAEETQIIDRMWDAYEVTRGEALSRDYDIGDERAARSRVVELRREISELGDPNIGAIEQYDRLNERHEFLTAQRDDVLSAVRELRALIAEITEQMGGIFLDGFAEIESSFKEVFAELFGGGEASLILEEPGDPLESGIEIAVQPPGKKLLTRTLLSGGERAFVAIALYFAILRVRPAPFVVLDEVDTALDESNVLRFAKYLRRVSARTQMIIISHKRGTMEEADTLIGVTMAERGVSRHITLSLDEAERTLA